MVKIIWTNRALTDLENIAEYISRNSMHYAKLTINNLVDTAQLIENNPQIGRIVPELQNEIIREIISGSYRIIYELSDQNTVNILSIHHSSRLLSNNPFFEK